MSEAGDPRSEKRVRKREGRRAAVGDECFPRFNYTSTMLEEGGSRTGSGREKRREVDGRGCHGVSPGQPGARPVRYPIRYSAARGEMKVGPPAALLQRGPAQLMTPEICPQKG